MQQCRRRDLRQCHSATQGQFGVADDGLMTSDAAPEGEAMARFTRDEAALIASVDDSVSEVLGWAPDHLIGRPSTDFIHPEDQPSAIAAWFAMLSAPGDPRVWRGRYQGADGTWKWVETVNVNRLDDPNAPFVFSTMTRIAVDQVSAEEELRARTQLLSRLSDALPVGLFQIDTKRKITFTNDQLHAITGCPPTATARAQFATVATDDLGLLDTVLAAVLANEPADDIELRLHLPPDRDGQTHEIERVCVLTMRPLTDSAGDVSGAIGCLSDVTERAQLRRELEIRASVDPLTACLNRATTLELLDATLARQTDLGAPTAIMFVDLNEFKQVNDRLGHAAGDSVLEIAARRLDSTLRVGDRAGRIGGDEFLVICPNVESSALGLEIGRRLARTLTTEISIGNDTVELRASIGVAWTDSQVDADAFVAQADVAMYEAKCKRDSNAVLYAPGHEPQDRTASQPLRIAPAT
jgi:diguanylate cyclase (GGDEF)-like protein/PAS domain S-box-containing protein